MMATDREAMIATIREHPDDDVPRLVCADWLEEQRDPASVARAEFIRVQIERSRFLSFPGPQPTVVERSSSRNSDSLLH